MPYFPHFLRRLLIEVHDQSFHEPPPRGIDKGENVHDFVYQTLYRICPLPVYFGTLEGNLIPGAVMPMMSYVSMSSATPRTALMTTIATPTRIGDRLSHTDPKNPGINSMRFPLPMPLTPAGRSMCWPTTASPSALTFLTLHSERVSRNSNWGHRCQNHCRFVRTNSSVHWRSWLYLGARSTAFSSNITFAKTDSRASGCSRFQPLRHHCPKVQREDRPAARPNDFASRERSIATPLDSTGRK